MAKKTTNTTTTINKIAVKKAQLEIIERFTRVLEEMKNDARTDYRITGKETEQARSWKTDELLWEDEEKTIPKYRDRWESVELTEEEMTEDKKAMLVAVEQMMNTLEEFV